jgi:hypothetical protein
MRFDRAAADLMQNSRQGVNGWCAPWSRRSARRADERERPTPHSLCPKADIARRCNGAPQLSSTGREVPAGLPRTNPRDRRIARWPSHRASRACSSRGSCAIRREPSRLPWPSRRRTPEWPIADTSQAVAARNRRSTGLFASADLWPPAQRHQARHLVADQRPVGGGRR